MTLTEQVLDHMLDGRPISQMSARQSYGIMQLDRVIWNIRIKGYHVSQKQVGGVEKVTGVPTTYLEYRMEDR